MKRVIGIGGIFFKAKDPEKLAAWYKKHLGFDVEDWGGATFPESAGADLTPPIPALATVQERYDDQAPLELAA